MTQNSQPKGMALQVVPAVVLASLSVACHGVVVTEQAPTTTAGPALLIDPAPALVEVLSDGTVTDRELRALRDAARSCMEAQGVIVMEFSIDRWGGYTLGYEPSTEAAIQTVAHCKARYFEAAAAAYAQAHWRADDWAEEAELMRACLHRLGVELPDDATREDMQAIDQTAFGECWNEVHRGQ